MKKRKIFRIASLIIAASILTSFTIWVLYQEPGQNNNFPDSDYNFPDSDYNFPYVIDSANGEVFNFSEYSGKVVVLEFMTVICSFCLQQGKNLQHLYETIEDRFFEVIKVDIGGSSDAALLNYMETNAFTYHIAKDVGLTLSSQFSIPGTPTTIFLDPNGKVFTQTVGLSSISQLNNTIIAAYNA